jgi:phosphate transport system permease protein
VALVPVVALLLIVINLAIGSMHAIDVLHFRLFTNFFSPSPESNISPDQMHYGILPALWGTVLVVSIAMIIAFPISLALAVLINDYSKGIVSSTLRWIISVLGGIPPIIYALLGGLIYLWFLWAKVGGKGLTGADLPQTVPTDQSATILGGMMLALLVIPFLTPLLDDALHSVPRPLKEASLSLGAGRWHTLTSVTLPYALPGIVNGFLLGILTALGEAIIVSYTIGFSAASLPKPMFDILERTPPFSSTIAYLAGGGYTFQQIIGPVGKSVANFMGLMLLLIAFIILGLISFLQHRMSKRSTQ